VQYKNEGRIIRSKGRDRSASRRTMRRIIKRKRKSKRNASRRIRGRIIRQRRWKRTRRITKERITESKDGGRKVQVEE
jgi:hypothetical protein